MIRINDLSVISSFDESIPKAAAHGETYLRAVAKGVQEYEPPVTMRLDTIAAARRMNVPEMQCLVIEPTASRLRRYVTAHYGIASGATLRVGWYLLGGDYAGGRQVGIFNVGAASDLDVDEVMSIVNIIQDYAVLPAIQQIVSTMSGAQGTGGFFGA